MVDRYDVEVGYRASAGYAASTRDQAERERRLVQRLNVRAG